MKRNPLKVMRSDAFAHFKTEYPTKKALADKENRVVAIIAICINFLTTLFKKTIVNRVFREVYAYFKQLLILIQV